MTENRKTLLNYVLAICLGIIGIILLVVSDRLGETDQMIRELSAALSIKQDQHGLCSMNLDLYLTKDELCQTELTLLEGQHQHLEDDLQKCEWSENSWEWQADQCFEWFNVFCEHPGRENEQ